MPAKKIVIATRERTYRVIPPILKDKILSDLSINHATDGKLRKTDIARRNAVSLNTVKKYEKYNKNQIAEIEKELQYNLSDIARRLTRAVTDDKIDNCSVPQLMVSTGIAIEKSLLLQGRPTEIVSDVPTDDSQLERFILDEPVPVRLPPDGVTDGKIIDVKSSTYNDTSNGKTVNKVDKSTKDGSKRT